jgi:hypothetical protein
MITLQQLDEAIELYERCLKEKWDIPKIREHNMSRGLCWFLEAYYKIEDFDAYEFIRLRVGHGYLSPEGDNRECSHKERFYPRIVFLKTLREELIKEGYYEINE